MKDSGSAPEYYHCSRFLAAMQAYGEKGEAGEKDSQKVTNMV